MARSMRLTVAIVMANAEFAATEFISSSWASIFFTRATYQRSECALNTIVLFRSVIKTYKEVWQRRGVLLLEESPDYCRAYLYLRVPLKQS